MGLTPGQGVWLDGVMTIPNELVQAAAEALTDEHLRKGQTWPLYTNMEDLATVALQAAFAKLPECEAARPRSGGGGTWDTYRRGWHDCLAALAREFGGQE